MPLPPAAMSLPPAAMPLPPVAMSLPPAAMLRVEHQHPPVTRGPAQVVPLLIRWDQVQEKVEKVERRMKRRMSLT